ncbi:hypothetical protein J4Q44_G00252460 [Coregonus suidteri]|uniref:Proteasome subunit alpha type n=1 Tax=Coregonus suidteri TaxID=861788 RepID=A0AAN8LE64_9TELE
MSSIGTGYDLSASTFSPDGRVFQVEYAMKAVENSSTAIGIRCKDGVVFGVEKLVLSKLYEQGSNKRIFNVDRHVGMAVAGLLADARSLSEVAREEASNFRSNYGHNIPLNISQREWPCTSMPTRYTVRCGRLDVASFWALTIKMMVLSCTWLTPLESHMVTGDVLLEKPSKPPRQKLKSFR